MQLHTIERARRKRGDLSRKAGSRSAGPPRDPRILAQAKVLWNRGWADVIAAETNGRTRYRNFGEYLASIPDIPAFPKTWDARFPHLVLVDRRIQIDKTCCLLKVWFRGGNESIVPFHHKQVPRASVYWMRCNYGGKYCRFSPSGVRRRFASRGDERGLDALEGLALYAQYPGLLKIRREMDLLSSVDSDLRFNWAYLQRLTDGSVCLYRFLHNFGIDPLYGFASRGIK